MIKVSIHWITSSHHSSNHSHLSIFIVFLRLHNMRHQRLSLLVNHCRTHSVWLWSNPLGNLIWIIHLLVGVRKGRTKKTWLWHLTLTLIYCSSLVLMIWFTVIILVAIDRVYPYFTAILVHILNSISLKHYHNNLPLV